MIVARIQHHPDRADLLPRLLFALEPIPTEVMTHSSAPPNPWEGYRRCLSDLPDCSHVLIAQDDTIPVPNFSSVLPKIAESIPDLPVCLFLGAAPAPASVKARRLFMRGKVRYIPLGASAFMPLVCVLWPKAVAEDFLDWSETGKCTRADDGNAARWMRERKVQVMCSVPSLAEHDDWTESVKGGRKATWGKDNRRRAALLAQDALDYEW